MVCRKCKKDLPIDLFSLKNKLKNIKQKICKKCHSLYRKQHYIHNKNKYIEKALRWNKKQANILSDFLFNYLSQSKCIDCGESDIIVLEFDHRNNKTLSIAEMYQNRYALETIREEINKCDVRCANCHRRKTAKNSKFWKYKLMGV